jgi:hypothetical protein
MVSAIRHHGLHIDHSAAAARAHLDANARQVAHETLAAVQQKVTDTALHELKDDQRLLDVFA